MPRRSVHKAPFISFEGGEGAGKTTQVKLLRRRLESLNLPVLVVREPGTTRLGEQVRQIIKSQSNNVPAADALLFMAARAQLMADVIVPELKKGTTVIGDRFSDSTIAYQGYGGNLKPRPPPPRQRTSTNGSLPDLTILLDVTPETGLGGVTLKTTPRRNPTPLRRITHPPPTAGRRGYRELASNEPNRWIEIDAFKRP